MAKLNQNLIVLIVIVGLIVVMVPDKKEGTTHCRASLSSCESDYDDDVAAGWKCVTPCVEVTSSIESCLGILTTCSNGDYYYYSDNDDGCGTLDTGNRGDKWDCLYGGAFCYDSDGTDTSTRGMVSGIEGVGNFEFEDGCVDSNTVAEQVCNGDTFGEQQINCPAGQSCSNGACIVGTCTPQWTGSPTCYEHAPGAWSVLQDYQEADCSTTTNKLKEFCANGETCSGGACQTGCLDSDGGRVYTVKGTVSFTAGGPTYTDRCEGAYVREFYCDGPTAQWEDYDCGANFICNDGICEADSPPTGNVFTVISTDAYYDSANKVIKAEYVIKNDDSSTKSFILESQVLFQADKNKKLSSGAEALCDTDCPFNVHKQVSIAAGATETIIIKIPKSGYMPDGEYFVRANTVDVCCPSATCDQNIYPFPLNTLLPEAQPIIQENIVVTSGGTEVTDLCTTLYCGDLTCTSGEGHQSCGLDCTCTDNDGDGYGTGDFSECEFQGLDCDDTRQDVRPGHAELQDGVDNDCDGEVDETTAPGDGDGGLFGGFDFTTVLWVMGGIMILGLMSRAVKKK